MMTVITWLGGAIFLALMTLLILGLIYWSRKRTITTATPPNGRFRNFIPHGKWNRYIGITVIAYFGFWIVLYICFPNARAIGSDWMAIVLGAIILTIIGTASPKWSAIISSILLLVLCFIGLGNRLEHKSGRLTKHTSPVSRPVSMPTEDKKVSESTQKVVVTQGKCSYTYAPWYENYKLIVDPPKSTVNIILPGGKRVTAGYGHERDNWGVVERGPWQITTSENHLVTVSFLQE